MFVDFLDGFVSGLLVGRAIGAGRKKEREGEGGVGRWRLKDVLLSTAVRCGLRLPVVFDS